jgi:hypothetical protein
MSELKGNPIRTMRSSHRIFLARRFYSGENPDSQEHNCPNRYPVRGHVQQVGGINQATDHDRESE